MFNGIDHLALFIGAGILLNLTPGPDVLYIVTHSRKSGWRTGAVAALGLSALLATSSTAFSVLKWLGAAYLVYVGWTMLGVRAAKPVLNATDSIATPAHPTRATGQNDLKKVFAKGFWTHVLNPKVALFFLAFVPQFIAPDAPDKTMAFLLLGYAALGAVVSQRFAALTQGMRRLERVAGVLFIGFGLKLALADNPSH